MVENEQVTGGLVSRDTAFKRFNEVPPTQSEYERESSEGYGRTNGLKGSAEEARMYHELLKTQGREPLRAGTDINEGEKEGLMDGILGVLGDQALKI